MTQIRGSFVLILNKVSVKSRSSVPISVLFAPRQASPAASLSRRFEPPAASVPDSFTFPAAYGASKTDGLSLRKTTLLLAAVLAYVSAPNTHPQRLVVQ